MVRSPAPPDLRPLAEELVTRAHEAGFALAGLAAVGESEHLDFYREWIGAERHGRMGYLARPDAVERRGDLRLTMPEVRSCLVVAHEYYQQDDAAAEEDPARPIIARYARGHDYHEVVKSKLEELRAWLDARVEGGVRGRAYVDTGPLLERELARRAGLGWFGRNTMLIHPARGSYFFLGALLLDLELGSSQPFAEDRCGTCRACLDACPTGALLGRDERGAPVIDARRCISYLTIELRDAIPRELRPAIGNRVHGCDICQEVCPWNERFARPAEEPAYRPRADLDDVSLLTLADTLLSFDESGFRERFRGSPLRRAKRAGLLRNVCVALGNWASPEAVPVLARALADPEPLVRGHAAWALGRIGTPEAVEALRRREALEEDAAAREELALALGSRAEARPLITRPSMADAIS